MKKQQWWLFKVFSQTLTHSSSTARPFCSLAAATTTTTTTTAKQQQLHMLLVEKKPPLMLIIPYINHKCSVDGSNKKELRKPPITVCDDTLGFISLFNDGDGDDNDVELNKNIKKEEVYKLYLPEIEDRRICGSSEGWLVTVHENGEIQLLNPISRVLVHLPPLTAFPEVIAKFVSEEIAGELVPKHKRGLCYLVDEDRDRPSRSSSRTYHFSRFVIHGSHHFHKFFLEKVVTTTTTTVDANSTTTVGVPTVVMAIYGCFRKLAFCRPSSSSSSTGNGIDNIDEPKRWISCLEGDKGGWQDVTFYKGDFYAVRHNGCVVVVKGLDGSSPFVETIIQKPEQYYTYMKYLVESSSSPSSGGGGDLLMVMRDVEIKEDDEENEKENKEEDERRYRTIEFSVLKLDFNGGHPSWVKITNLGEDCALFIGYNHSFSFSASKFSGCRGNCIYFTDNNSELFHNDTYGGHDMGVYNLEDDSFEDLYETSSSHLFMPPPIWYVPN